MAWSPEDIRKLRTELGLSLRGMAAELGVTHTSIGRLESGASRPDAAFKARLRELEKRCPRAQPVSDQDRLLAWIIEHPLRTTQQVLLGSGARPQDLEALAADGRAIKAMLPALEPDRLGRQRQGFRWYVPGDVNAAADTHMGRLAEDAELLRGILDERGWQEKQLAVAMKVSPPTLSRHLRGVPPPMPPRRRERAIRLHGAPAADEPPRDRDLERLCRTVRAHPWERPAAVIDRVGKLKGLDRGRAEKAFQRALAAKQVHLLRRPYRDKAGRPRMALRVGPGAGRPPSTETPSLASEDLRARREAIGLSPAQIGELMRPKASRGAVEAWERRGIPPARLAPLLGLLDELEALPRLEPPDPVAEARERILGVVENYPDIGRTPLLEGDFGETTVGKTVASIEALRQLLRDGLLVFRSVPHRRRRPHMGLRLRGALPADSPQLLGRELRELRERAGLSQPQAAAVCSTKNEPISPSRWRTWERQKEGPINPLTAPRLRERLEAQPPASSPARGGQRRAPFDETMALVLQAFEAEETRSSTELRKICHERKDVPAVTLRAEELNLIHRRDDPGFDPRLWRRGPKPAPEKPVTGTLIREARLAAGILQGDAAKRIGVSESTLSGWEHGRPVPEAHWPDVRAFVEDITD